MMELDVTQVLLGSFQAVVLVVFLVQTIVEAVPALQGRFTPLVALLVGLGTAAVINLAPAWAQETLGTGLALAAAASMTVRYVKRTGEGQDAGRGADENQGSGTAPGGGGGQGGGAAVYQVGVVDFSHGGRE